MKNIQRTTIEIDATSKAPGRLATEVSTILIGKHKATFMPNVDAGDSVRVINAAKMVVTGKKLEQKKYYSHSGYAKGLKTVHMGDVFSTNPGDVLRRAVSRMLPKNTHREPRLARLEIVN